MKITFIALLFISSLSLYSQENCLLYPEGSDERKSCDLCYKALEQKQGSKASQELFDEAIRFGPKLAYAYYEKSVPYFKRGFLKEGLQVLNEAVKLEPLEYLCNRAYWFWQYKNYNLCVADLEKYYALTNSYIRYDPSGEKNMKMILGMAYARLGDYNKAIQVIKDHLNSFDSENDADFADFHTLGVIYVKNKEYDKAIATFEIQFKIVDNIIASHYYLGLAYRGKSKFEEAKISFKQALLTYEDKYRYRDGNAGFPVYKTEIEQALEELENGKL